MVTNACERADQLPAHYGPSFSAGLTEAGSAALAKKAFPSVEEGERHGQAISPLPVRADSYTG